jgi:cation:H+ antiporter
VTLSLIAIVGGLSAAIWASRVVVGRTAALVRRFRISPFLSGLVILALGTDLPEIANSVVSSVGGHGDINVGDSIGSTVTQSTLILGLLPLIGGAFVVARRDVVSVGAATAVALGAGVFMMADGRLGRADAAVLIALWVIASYVSWTFSSPEQLPLPLEPVHAVRPLTFLELIGGLTVVVGGASVAVRGLVTIADSLRMPEYIVGFFLASIGTSLPELVVDATALRQGERDMAVGGLFGASLLDSTLSLGAGPLISPVAVTASLAIRGSLTALAAVGVVTALLAGRERHDAWSAATCLLVYGAFFAILLP